MEDTDRLEGSLKRSSEATYDDINNLRSWIRLILGLP